MPFDHCCVVLRAQAGRGTFTPSKAIEASPAKKKRKAQQNIVESKPSVGVHGPDLFLQARLAAEVGY